MCLSLKYQKHKMITIKILNVFKTTGDYKRIVIYFSITDNFFLALLYEVLLRCNISYIIHYT
jgi:hypothetical protein